MSTTSCSTLMKLDAYIHLCWWWTSCIGFLWYVIPNWAYGHACMSREHVLFVITIVCMCCFGHSGKITFIVAPIPLSSKILVYLVSLRYKVTLIKLLSWSRATHMCINLGGHFFLFVFNQSSQHTKCGGDLPRVSYVATLQ